MKDNRRLNNIKANEEVTENIRTILLQQAEGFLNEAKSYYEKYNSETDEVLKRGAGDMFQIMYGKTCACYNNMKALGIISENEEYTIILQAFERATGVKML